MKLINLNYLLFTFCFISKSNLNPFPNKPCFLRVCITSLMKTSNFSFPHSVFYKFLPFLSDLKLSSVNSFSLEESKNCCFVVWERVKANNLSWTAHTIADCSLHNMFHIFTDNRFSNTCKWYDKNLNAI